MSHWHLPPRAAHSSTLDVVPGGRPARSRAEIERAFRRWLWQYNHLRPHEALGGRTPFEALHAFAEYATVPQFKP